MLLMLHFIAFAIVELLLGLLLSTPCNAKEATDSDEKDLITSYNQTALQLYRQLQAESKNLVISPYSIGTAMSMALSGARGDTEKEMAQVLSQLVPRERMDAANSRILDRMNRFQQAKNLMLSTANALCLTGYGEMVPETYRNLLRTQYRADRK
jgi:serine protease inhibitor